MNRSSRLYVASLAAGCLLGLASLVPHAQAATVTKTFTVVGLPGAGGSITFDPASVPTDASGQPLTNGFGEVEVVLTALSLDLGGRSFALGDLEGSAGNALFDDGTLLGVDALADDMAFALVPGSSGQSPYLMVSSALLGGATSFGGYRSFAIQFAPAGAPTPVPLPGSLALVLAGLAGAVATSRRRGRQARDAQPVA
jgi:hypothetical protein